VSETKTPRRIYLDVCALSRPFDDQDQARIRMETEAVGLILGHVRTGRLSLVVSPVHTLEISATMDLEERAALEQILTELGHQPRFDAHAVRRRAEALATLGLGPADAAHLAFAEAAKACFATVDDQLLRRVPHAKPSVWVGTPMGYCEKEDLK
jgi:predicted nucleic acid-binding protein